MRLDQLPIHIQEAIKGVRVIKAGDLGKLERGKYGHYLCRWCKTEVQPPRRTWCGDYCFAQFQKLTEVLETIYARDDGNCRSCGVDIDELTSFHRQAGVLISSAETAALKYLSTKENKYCLELAELKLKIARIQEAHPDWFTDRHDDWSRKLFPDIPVRPIVRLKHSRLYEIDHIIPVSKGGTTTSDNLMTLCIDCHRKKTNEERKRK